VDLNQALKNVEDYLIPRLQLDSIERALYYHLLRHTRVAGKDSALFGVLSLSDSCGISESTVRERIRALHEKGCVRIEDRSAKGHLLRVLLPNEIDGIVPDESETSSIMIEDIDFFSDRNHVSALVERENCRCFYCLRQVEAETAVLDHVIPQRERIDNSYRNVVASCHECNALKQGQDAESFFRLIYRKGLLSQAELQERLATLEKLKQGQVAPRI
jgi:hypothetical protein